MIVSCAINNVILGEDVKCMVTGSASWDDYGVPGSPRWLEFYAQDIEYPVSVGDQDYPDETSLETEYPGMVDAILEYATEDGVWEE